MTTTDAHLSEGGLRRRQRINRYGPQLSDPRWIAAVLAVVVAVLAGVKILTAHEETVVLQIAKRTLVPGEEVHNSDLREVRVNIGDHADRYVSDVEGLGPRSVALEHVGVGELVPKTALGSAAQAALAPVVVEVGKGQELTARAGSAVQVWVARRQGQSLQKPGLIVEKAYVGQKARHPLDTRKSVETTSVEVYVPIPTVAAVIEAANSDATITLVPRTVQ